MEYRVLPHGGEQVSVIGMGSSVIGAQPEKEIIATVRAAVDSGVNYFDMAGGHAAIFAAYGKALEGIRDKVKIMVGGAPIDQSFCDEIGADMYTEDAAAAARAAVEILQGQQPA